MMVDRPFRNDSCIALKVGRMALQVHTYIWTELFVAPKPTTGSFFSRLSKVAGLFSRQLRINQLVSPTGVVMMGQSWQ